MCRVQLQLLPCHGCIHHAFELLGQVGKHLRLQAAQHERAHERLQPARDVLVATDDRQLEALAEARIGAEQPRHQEIENAPKLGEAVLHRSARERETMLSLDALHRARDERRRVLHVLRLVESAQEETLPHPVVDIDAKQVVGGHEHIARVRGGRTVGRGKRERPDAAALGFRARDGANRELGREAGKFLQPVVHERRRAHDKAWPHAARLVAAGEQKRDELQRLAQAHLVGEDAAEPRIAARRKPAEAFFLIGAQHARELGGRRVALLVDRAEVVHVAFEGAVAVEIFLFVEIKRAIARQLDLAVREFFQRDSQVRRNAIELGQVHVLKRKVRAALELVVVLALAVARQQRGELVGLQIARAHRQVDQIARKRHPHGDARLAVADEAVEGGRGEDLAERAELGQAAEEQVAHRIVVGVRNDRVPQAEVALDKRRRPRLEAGIAQRPWLFGVLSLACEGDPARGGRGTRAADGRGHGSSARSIDEMRLLACQDVAEVAVGRNRLHANARADLVEVEGDFAGHGAEALHLRRHVHVQRLLHLG